MIIELVKAVMGLFVTYAEPEDGSDQKRGKANGVKPGRLITILALSLGAFVTWSIGLVPNTSGFARAADVKQEVAQQVKPVVEKVDKVDAKVTDMQGALYETLAFSTAQSINAKKRASCKSTEAEERSRLASEISGLLAKYQKYSGGNQYTVPSCGEL